MVARLGEDGRGPQKRHWKLTNQLERKSSISYWFLMSSKQPAQAEDEKEKRI